MAVSSRRSIVRNACPEEVAGEKLRFAGRQPDRSARGILREVCTATSRLPIGRGLPTCHHGPIGAGPIGATKCDEIRQDRKLWGGQFCPPHCAFSTVPHSTVQI